MNATVLTVILNYRTPAMTLRAARAALDAMDGIDGAITIVDNDSQDGSFEALVDGTADWPRVRILQAGRNGGFGAGNNHGIRAGLPDGAQPDFVYLLNSDAFPEPDAIVRLRDHMRAHSVVGFAGSHVRGEDDIPHVTAFRFPSLWSEFEDAAHTGVITRLLRNHVVPMDLPAHVQAVDWCAGASVMLRMDTLDQVGLFDEGFFLYFEETDLCHRIQAAGWVGQYLPDSRVVHIGSASTGMKTWARKPEYWFASRARYFRKRGGRPYLALVTLAYLLGAGLWKLRRLIERKDERIAPYFLRDLVTHTWHDLTSVVSEPRHTSKIRNAGDKA
ncbi:MAG: glycosyltransferase family 2 protein [Rhodobacteraceae bacterium]|nr:glycosyltransferase family 2 protein [Paracoccaceae bacterium]